MATNPRMTRVLAIILVVLSATPALQPSLGHAKTADVHDTLHDREAVDYRVSNASGGVVAWINATVEGTTDCRDGLNRSFECLDVRETTGRPGTIPDHEEEMFGVSLAHAETITEGSWPAGDVGAFDTQFFAAVHRSFSGFPLPPLPPGGVSSSTAERMFAVAGLSVPLRVGASGPGSASFSGIEGEIRTTSGPNGTVIAQATFDDIHANASYRYTSVLDDEGGFPQTLRLETIENGTSSLTVEAERIRHDVGGNPVNVTGWHAIDVSTQREEVDFLPWQEHPPTRGQAFFYPIEEAYNRTRLDPDAIQYRDRHPDAYVTRIRYERDIHNAGVDLLRGEWFFIESSPNAPQQISEAVRDVPVAVHENTKERTPHGTGVDQADTRSNNPEGWYAPSRSELPDRMLTVEDAWAVGRSAVGSENLRDTELGWDASLFPRYEDTAMEARYLITCDSYGGPRAAVDGATGAIVFRNTIFRPSC